MSLTRKASVALVALVSAGVLVLVLSLRDRDHGDFSVIKSEDGVEHGFVAANGIRLHVATAGPQDGPPVILLHGYPDAHFGWIRQIVALAQAGFRVIVPDQRGYNLSDKPKGIGQYGMDILVEDVMALADHYGLDTFNLAGHDFGGIVSWNLAHTHPERLDRMVILNAPHPVVMSRFLRNNAEQRRRSWYAYFFQVPVLPELLTRAGNWAMLARSLEGSFSEDEINEYRRAWAQPGASTAMINWYRAFLGQDDTYSSRSRLDVPTLVIWGKQDPHIMWQSAHPSAAMSTAGEVIYIDDATHWVLRDAPQETGELLVDFFSTTD